MLRLCLALVGFLGASLSVQADTLRILTSNSLAPFAGGTEADPNGFHYELLTILATRAGVSFDLEYGPWERSQMAVQAGENAYLMAPTRNAKREDLYDWIIPVLDVDRVFLTTGPAIDDYDAARSLGRIAARGSYLRALESEGFENIEQVETENALRMLQAGRVDSVFTIRERAVIVWRNLGFAPDQLTAGASVNRTTLWLAGPKGSDPAIAEKLRAALEAAKADGTYAELYEAHFGPSRDIRVVRK